MRISLGCFYLCAGGLFVERTTTLLARAQAAPWGQPTLSTALIMSVMAGLVTAVALLSTRLALSPRGASVELPWHHIATRGINAAVLLGLIASVPVKRDAVWEIGMALSVLVVSAALAGAPPSRNSSAAPPAIASSSTVFASAAILLATVPATYATARPAFPNLAAGLALVAAVTALRVAATATTRLGRAGFRLLRGPSAVH